MLGTTECYIQHLLVSVAEISELIEPEDIAREEKSAEN
jgi:hypothetical protein